MRGQTFAHFLSRLVLGIGGTLLIAIFYFLYSTFVFRVEVVNRSSVSLTKVELIMPGGDIWRGALNPGDRHVAYGFPGGEGVLAVAFDATGHHHREDVTYVTDGAAQNLNVTIRPDLKMQYNVDERYRIMWVISRL